MGVHLLRGGCSSCVQPDKYQHPPDNEHHPSKKDADRYKHLDRTNTKTSTRQRRTPNQKHRIKILES